MGRLIVHVRAAASADDPPKLAILVTFLVIVDGKIVEVEAFAFGSG